MTVHSTSSFYSDLTGFDDFSEIANLDSYKPMPDDWTLLMTDVVNSTGAIESGQYKNVNMVGAASIISVLNAVHDVSLPYVFGGDGGLIAVPPEYLETASMELRKLQAGSASLFGLELRAAAIPVKDLREAGADTLVRKYHLAKGNHLAMLSGDGPQLADDWLKEDKTSRGYALPPIGPDEAPNLDGLTCRWEPLTTRNGTMLTVIVKPLNEDDQGEIENITNRISDILGGSVAQFAPLQTSNLKLRSKFSDLVTEFLANAKRASGPLALAKTYWAATIHYVKEQFTSFSDDEANKEFIKEMKTNTDFRKYDGTLRMVLDISEQQADEIIEYLEGEYQSGKLVYGTWQADAALLTCLLFNFATDQHVHLIDGANGGYAMAAKNLKQRLSSIKG